MRLFFFLACSLISIFGFTQTENRIWYEKPAARWTEALPLGNGRLGVMVFGGIDDELLQLNESSLWSGGPVLHHVNDQAPFYLTLCRNALLKNEFDSAEYYAKKMQGLYSESYLPLADFTIHQSFKNNDSVKAYSRELNIQDAVSVTRFTRNGIHFKREIFVSAPAQLIVIRIRADKPNQLTLDLGLNSQLHFQRGEVGPEMMGIQGKAPVRADPNYFNSKENAIRYTDSSKCNGMRFEVQVKAFHRDGELSIDTLGMHVKSATEMLIYISAATSFNGFDKCPDKDGKDEQRITSGYISRLRKENLF